jgi:hypothetical protein
LVFHKFSWTQRCILFQVYAFKQVEVAYEYLHVLVLEINLKKFELLVRVLVLNYEILVLVLDFQVTYHVTHDYAIERKLQ